MLHLVSLLFFVLCNSTAPTEIDTFLLTLSLPDAPPICRIPIDRLPPRKSRATGSRSVWPGGVSIRTSSPAAASDLIRGFSRYLGTGMAPGAGGRSEEHTSELQ